MKKIITVALVGNPNTGKSSLFNALTGLKQKTANFPGITVDKHTGYFNVGEKTFIELIDLPGTYSLFPKSKDEVVPFEILSNPKHKNYPQLIIFIGDASNLGRNLILLTQIIDCGLPVILALNMIDLAKAQGIEIDSNKLSEILGIPVIQTNARNNEGVEELKKSLIKQISKPNLTFYNPQIKTEGKLEEVAKLIPHQTEYQLILNINKIINNPDLETNKVIQDAVLKFKSESQMDAGVYQRNDLLFRHKKVKEITTECIDSSHLTRYKERQSKFDKILTHPIYGFLIFFFILFIIFQSIFSWAELPMQWIEALIAFGKEKVRILFGSGILSSLISDGIISGLGGVVTFIPQIAFLFLFITVLDDTGYLPRVAFMMDRFMRKLGLNGKSIIPLISGTACAVPAIMAARNIENTKSRLITILVTPLMSCSARLPVFILLISLFVPNVSLYGLFQLRGLVLFGMYLLGFLAVICSAYVFNLIIKNKGKQYFILELPLYRSPNWKNVGSSVLSKVRTFVGESGKIIIAISIILWFLSAFGPKDTFNKIEVKNEALIEGKIISEKQGQINIKSEKLQNSYAGQLGRTIEPVIAPLGYDWKIGIALITSFAAREVFVGTMATLYGLENEEGDIKSAMISAKNPTTGKPIYTLATALSLLIFYAFALQCMSTIAITYKETASLKWTIVQIIFMTGLAYLSSLIVYQLLK